MKRRLAWLVIAYAQSPRGRRMLRRMTRRLDTPATRRRAGQLARWARRRLLR